ncbi:MAG: hypothetical protein JSS81_23345 [Acidobacteria bacterium]|nr:hypothetical protein [Acidobacteriota bacterium]
MSLRIFGDNRIEASWFRSLSKSLKDANFEKIRGRGQNPRLVDNLIQYDRPDIILTRDDIPVLVVEKTREVPTGHNVGQRAARLVRAVELGVPTICFFPFDSRKHGEYTGICNLNIRLLKAFEKMYEIHGTPIIAVNWLTDEHGELIGDGSENESISKIVNGYIDSGFNPNCRELIQNIEINKLEYDQRLDRRKSYSKPPNSVVILQTDQLIATLENRVSRLVAQNLNLLKESVVYTMDMKPAKCRREDPYTGTQFIYDYIWCRNGRKVEQKHRNLILHFPSITKQKWYESNPNDVTRKSCNWYLTATALIFSDAVDLLRGTKI